ncbi:ABC transporter permease [Rhizocola hellebori]|uniref:ABC transporter permease n=1 Tax=Rhizocola hellebori TaxID=1392758 RepID=A0A8J3QH34_9ACTN|nr:ABC transporter permease [Rhizocola hellebori]GIH09514.1 ABC transporter permease [Rhizocola hellebori]
MLNLAWQTLRSRPSRFAGTFVALSLGVALIAATGLVLSSQPEAPGQSRYAPGSAVIVANPQRSGIRPSTVDSLRGLDPGVTADRSFGLFLVPVQAAQGHGWTSAGFGPYTLAQGHPPRADDEIVVDSRIAAAGWTPGSRVQIVTESGAGTYVVAGVTGPAGTGEAPVFFTDAQAARLSPRVDAVVVPAGSAVSADAIRAVDARLRVLTGDGVRQAEPDPVADAYEESATLLALMAAISGFVSVFVVAATFALSINQRRRELALLRIVGATARQTRRMVMMEALLVGLCACGAGALLALPVAEAMVALLRGLDVGPPRMNLALSPVPLIVAVLLGFVVALAGVWFASRRTRRIRASEALRQAAVEPAPMTLSRWIVGVLATGGAIAMLAAMPGTDVDGRTSIALLVGQVLVIGAAALAPALMRPLIRLLWWPLRRVADATVEVAQANLRAQARRTASVAAPVLVMVGVAGSFLAATSSLERSSLNEIEARTSAPVVLLPIEAPGLTEAALVTASNVDGVAAVAPIAETHVFIPAGGGFEEYSTQAFPGEAIAGGALRFEVRSGSLAEFRGEVFAVSQAFAAQRGWRVGQVTGMLLDDGSEASLRLVATVDGGISGGSVFLPADRVRRHLTAWNITHALITVKPGSDPGAVRELLQASLNGQATAVDRHTWLTLVGQAQHEGIRIGLIAILGMAGLYTAIAIVNTLVMAVRERAQDLAQLRLAGATRRQAMRMLLWEGALISVAGIVLGAFVTATTLVAMPLALRTMSATAQASLPLAVLSGIGAVCAALILVTSLLSGTIAQRSR